MTSTNIIDVDLPDSGFALKDLPENRLIMMGYRNGKELACMIDVSDPDSWRVVIEKLIQCFDQPS